MFYRMGATSGNLSMEDKMKMSRDFEEKFQNDTRNGLVAGRELVLSQCGMPVAIMLSLPKGAIASDRPASCTFNCLEGKVVDVICMRAHMLGQEYFPAQYWFLDQSKIVTIDTRAVSHTSHQGSCAYADASNLIVYAQVTGRPRFISWIDAHTQMRCYGRRQDGDQGFRFAARGGPLAPSERLLEHSETVRAAILMGASGASEADLRANRTLPALTGPQMEEAHLKMSPGSWRLFVEGYRALSRGRGWMGTIVIDQTSKEVAEATAVTLKGTGMFARVPAAEFAVGAAYGDSQTGPMPMVSSPKGTVIAATLTDIEGVKPRRKELTTEDLAEELAYCRGVAKGNGLLGDWRSHLDATGLGLPVGTRVKVKSYRTRQAKGPPLVAVAPVGAPGSPNSSVVPGDLGVGAKYVETVRYYARPDGGTLTMAGAGEFGDLVFREVSDLLKDSDVVMDCYDIAPRNADRTGLVQCTAQGTLLGGANTLWQIRPLVKETDLQQVGRVAANHLLVAASALGETIRTYPVFGLAHPTTRDHPGGNAGPPSKWTPHIASWGTSYFTHLGAGLPQQATDGGLAGASIFGNLEYPGCRAGIVDQGALRGRSRQSMFAPGPGPEGLPIVKGAYLLGANSVGEARSAITIKEGVIHIIVASPALGGFTIDETAPLPLINGVDGAGHRILGCDRLGFHRSDVTAGLCFTVRSGHVGDPAPVMVENPIPRTFESVSESALGSVMANAWGAPTSEGAVVPPLELEALFKVMLRQVDVAAAQRRAGGVFGRTRPEMGCGEDDDQWALGVLALLADVRGTPGHKDDFERHFGWASELDLASALYDQLVRGASERALQALVAVDFGLSSNVEERVTSDCFVTFQSRDRESFVDISSGRVVLMESGGASDRASMVSGYACVDSRSRLITGSSRLKDNPDGNPLVEPRGPSIGREAARSASRPREVAFAPSAPAWADAYASHFE
jgi:hypothetical protein